VAGAPLTADLMNRTVEAQGVRQWGVRVRGLFLVAVVSPESGAIVASEQIVADSEDNATLKVLRSIDIDPDDVDIIVVRLGNVRPKKSVQEVKVVK
jgi:hypothetical protein